ncbi:hypothetical protein M8J76_001026 [Diaphorina citri]|nr:hypothetical protein M8J76_001026 [Diaphorina citri]KAI5734363.1 hypothetical protein M8J77_005544 [Diaphorina citri]
MSVSSAAATAAAASVVFLPLRLLPVLIQNSSITSAVLLLIFCYSAGFRITLVLTHCCVDNARAHFRISIVNIFSNEPVHRQDRSESAPECVQSC